jgi:hypothetical protein
MLIFEESYLRKSVVQGSTPQEYILLGTNIASHRSELRWCGTVIDQKRFACSGPGALIDFVMPDRSHDVCMLVKPDILTPAISQQAQDLLNGKMGPLRAPYAVMRKFFGLARIKNNAHPLNML